MGLYLCLMLTFKGVGFSYAEGGEVVYSCGPNGMTDSEFKEEDWAKDRLDLYVIFDEA